jgi:hypothetical protein
MNSKVWLEVEYTIPGGECLSIKADPMTQTFNFGPLSLDEIAPTLEKAKRVSRWRLHGAVCCKENCFTTHRYSQWFQDPPPMSGRVRVQIECFKASGRILDAVSSMLANSNPYTGLMRRPALPIHKNDVL